MGEGSKARISTLLHALSHGGSVSSRITTDLGWCNSTAYRNAYSIQDQDFWYTLDVQWRVNIPTNEKKILLYEKCDFNLAANGKYGNQILLQYNIQ